MKFGIDGREIQQGVYTGIGRALYDLLCHFDTHASGDTCVVFSAKPLPFVFSSRIINRVVPEHMTFWWDQVQLPLAVREAGVDVFYSPYYKLPLLAPCRKVSAVLDLIYLEFPEYRRKLSFLRRLYYTFFGRLFLRAADRIHTCSHFSQRDICRVYGVDPARVAVIPLGVASGYGPEADDVRIGQLRERFGIPGRYVLYLGNFKPHKNVGALLEAFIELAPEFPDITLVLAGPKTHGYGSLVARARRAGMAERVVFTDTVTDLLTGRLLYAGAEVFVMPSLYEGFGLPPLEAMACGAAVVSSSSSSLPEVAGDAARMVNADEPPDIAKGIRELLKDHVLRRIYKEKGPARAAQFSQERIMPQMMTLLRSVSA